MMRGYAIGLGAGTQVLTQLVGELAAVPESPLNQALLLGAGWVINLAVAEVVSHHHQLPGGGVEHFAATLGDQHGVLDAHASLAGQVDAGLDGHDHAGL